MMTRKPRLIDVNEIFAAIERERQAILQKYDVVNQRQRSFLTHCWRKFGRKYDPTDPAMANEWEPFLRRWENNHGPDGMDYGRVAQRVATYRAQHPERVRAEKAAYRVKPGVAELNVARRAAYYAAHRDAKREYSRKYNATHRDAVRERNRSYRARHRDVELERHRKYRAAHRDVLRERQRRYNATHQEARREYSRKYTVAHHAEYLEYQRKYRLRMAIQKLLSELRQDGQHVSVDSHVAVRSHVSRETTSRKVPS